MTFLFVKVGNSQWQHCLPCQEAPIYQIWAQYHKVWCRYGHDLGHLAWNPRMFIHGRPYCEASFFKKIQNSCLAFFMETSSRKRTPCASFSFCWFFFIFINFFQNRVKFVHMQIHTKKLNLSQLSVVFDIVTTWAP